MDDSDESDSDSDEDDPLVSGQIRISVHILPEIKSEQVELPLEEDLDSGEIEADPAWRVDVQRRCVTIECCQYEVAVYIKGLEKKVFKIRFYKQSAHSPELNRLGQILHVYLM